MGLQHSIQPRAYPDVSCVCAVGRNKHHRTQPLAASSGGNTVLRAIRVAMTAEIQCERRMP
jgi:hypothetical protein